MSLRMFLKKVIDCCGVVEWWPSTDPFEISIQAILTQNTSWKNVLKATENLRSRGLMSPKSLFESDIVEIEKAIRPSGFYRIKAKRIKSFVSFLFDKLEGHIENLKNYPLKAARNMLLSVEGIGKETADTILLFALDFPIMVVDAYTRRVLSRAGFDIPRDYDSLRELIEKNSPRRDSRTFKLLHSGFDELAKRYCKKTSPKCSLCPLSSLCKGSVRSEYS